MDWLMGKARGVGRGLIHAPTGVSALTVTESVNSNGGNLSSTNNGTSNSVVSQVCLDYEPKTSFMNAKEMPHVDQNTSPVTYSSNNVVNPIVQNAQFTLDRDHSVNIKQAMQEINLVSDTPKYINNFNLSQQLPLSADSAYPEFSTIVEPFPAIDINEWLAAHTIALFDNLSTIFDAIYDLCDCHTLLDSMIDCEIHTFISPLLADFLNNPSIIHLLQNEDDRNKKSKSFSGVGTPQMNKICARLAIDGALSSCHDLIQSSRIFPVRNGEQFPCDLPQHVSTICKTLLVCILHIYVAHFHHLDQLELVPHMNTLAKHFVAFNKRFSLIDDKQLEPLACFGRSSEILNEPKS